MEDAQEAYSQEDEVRGMNFHLGIDETNSNGHGERKDEDINLVETIRKLQAYVQRNKFDNQRLMKAKEKHEYFNMNLMKSMDKIEKN